MSDWDDKADDHAVAHHTYEHMPPAVNAKIYMGFVLGARWQREQLRTDETVERVALELISQRGYYTGEGWPTNQDLSGGPTSDRDVEFKSAWMDNAREVTTALLGEKP